MLRTRGLNAVGVGRSEGCDVVCDLVDGETVQSLMVEFPDSTVIHCAAEVPNSGSSYLDQYAATRSLIMVGNLTQARPKRVIFTSSMTVYPENIERAREEDAGGIGQGYAGAKFDAERILLACRDTVVTILRFPGIFGPPRRSGVLFNAAISLAQGNLPRIEEPLPQWAAIHIDDAAEICIRAAMTPLTESVILNAGYPERMAISDAVRQLGLLFGQDLNLPKPRWFAFDLSLLTSVLGPVTGSFSERVVELANWVRQEAKQGSHA
jgi:nucleoside-diphosphate-sugar epimerase